MMMKPKAIIVGLLADVAGSVLVGIVLGVVAGIIAVTRGATSPEALVALRANVYLNAIGLAGTTFFTGLGGYLAARMSRSNGINNALAVGGLSLLLGIALAVFLPGITPRWKLIAGLVLTLPAAFVGGRIVTRTAQYLAGADPARPGSAQP